MFDAFERIRAGLAGVASESRAGLPAPPSRDGWWTWSSCGSGSTPSSCAATGQWDAEGCWAEDGAVSGASWLAQHTSMSRARPRGLRAGGTAGAGARRDGGAALASGAVVFGPGRHHRRRHPQPGRPLSRQARRRSSPRPRSLGADEFANAARYWRSPVPTTRSRARTRSPSTSAGYLHSRRRCSAPLRIDGELDLDGGETLLERVRRRSALPTPTTTADGRAAQRRQPRSRWRPFLGRRRRRTTGASPRQHGPRPRRADGEPRSPQSPGARPRRTDRTGDRPAPHLRRHGIQRS